MDFVAVLNAWVENPDNAENPFLELVKTLAGIIAFIASL